MIKWQLVARAKGIFDYVIVRDIKVEQTTVCNAGLYIDKMFIISKKILL